jgi:GDP-D-mannose 3', 5'-epimerase
VECRRRGLGLLAADMDGMGLHRDQQSLVHADRPRKHPYAGRRPRRESRALLLLVGVRIRRRQAGGSKCQSLKESDAYPAMPEDGYGWETLFTQRMCQHFLEDFHARCVSLCARRHGVHRQPVCQPAEVPCSALVIVGTLAGL